MGCSGGGGGPGLEDALGEGEGLAGVGSPDWGLVGDHGELDQTGEHEEEVHDEVKVSHLQVSDAREPAMKHHRIVTSGSFPKTRPPPPTTPNFV